jgi:hypothetical protein
MNKAIYKVAREAVKDNDREMKVALMNRYPDDKKLWKILFPNAK